MNALTNTFIGLLILIGLGGAVTQLYPGPLLVGLAVLAWAWATGGTTAWVCALLGVVALVVTGVGKYVVMGRTVVSAGLGRWSLLAGAVLGVVGFFVVPLIGLPIGFVLGVGAAEWLRVRNVPEARDAAVVALKAQGWAILFELAGCLLAAVAWAVGAFLVAGSGAAVGTGTTEALLATGAGLLPW